MARIKLAISPHPDDIEYSMKALIDSDISNFRILLLSYGSVGDTTASTERTDEVLSYWQDKGINIHHFDFAFNWKINDLIRIIDQYDNIDEIYCPSLDDTNQDHRLTAQAARTSCRHRMVDLIEYKTPSTNSSWEPNWMFPISESEFEMKYDKFQESFASQSKKPYLIRDTYRLFHQDFISSKRGGNLFEYFKIIHKYTK